MATLNLTDARKLMTNGRPWTFRLEYRDSRPPNFSNSHKFWLCTGRGRNEPVEVHYGRVGNKAQIIVKDWTYVEAKTPEKIAKGYAYAQTGFVKVQQSTIDNHNASQAVAATKPLPAKPKPIPPAPPTPPVSNPSLWSDKKAGVSCAIKGSNIELLFDQFPAPWQGAVFHTFKAELEAICVQTLGRKVGVWWGTQGPKNSQHVFHAKSPDKGLFQAIVAFLQKQIGGVKVPLTPPPGLTGPYAKVVMVKPAGQGIWHAMNASGNKVLDLTKTGARDLVTEYPHIQVAGL